MRFVKIFELIQFRRGGVSPPDAKLMLWQPREAKRLPYETIFVRFVLIKPYGMVKTIPYIVILNNSEGSLYAFKILRLRSE